ncbi:MAG: ABC transporter permease [Candidatus Bathyarchaeia archaeon]
MVLEAISSILSFFPVIGLATLGGFLSQKSGVWNIAIEGMMAFGTFSGVLAYHYLGHSIWISLLFGFVLGLAFGALLSVLCVYHGLDQIVVGFGLWFLAEGLAGFLYLTVLPPSVRITETLGPKFLSLDPIFYLTITSFLILYVTLKRTKQGLAITAVGENPRAADTAGIDVHRVRWICTTLGAGFIGLAGAYLSLVILQGFTYKLVAGYGWAAFALILFGRWTTPGIFFGSLFFTFLIGLQTRLQVAEILVIPTEFMVVIPHIGVVIALALAGALGKRAGMPSALGTPYERE